MINKLTKAELRAICASTAVVNATVTVCKAQKKPVVNYLNKKAAGATTSSALEATSRRRRRVVIGALIAEMRA